MSSPALLTQFSRRLASRRFFGNFVLPLTKLSHCNTRRGPVVLGAPRNSLFVLDQPFLLSARGFAGNRRQGKQSDKNQPLVNENLVRVLVSRSKRPNAHEMEVRLLREAPRGSEKKNSSEIVPLSQAIQKSVELDEDLIGISIDQDVPVLQVAKLNAFLYKKAKKKKNSEGSLQPKEVRFKAGIADNDLDRKVNQMVKWLTKGHNCMVTVSCKHWQVRTDPNKTVNAVQRVLLQVGDSAELMHQPKYDTRKITAKFTLHPSPKLKKS